MKTKGRRQSTNVIDLRKASPTTLLMHEMSSVVSAKIRPHKEVDAKVKKDLDGALTRIRQTSAVKQTRDRLPLEVAREIMKKRSNKKQDRLR